VRGALDRVSGTYNAVNVESVQFNDVDIDVIDAPRRYGQSLTFTFRIKRDDVEIAQGTPVTGAMLGDLYNVDVAGVTDNQILSYDAATGNWVPADDAGGLVDSVNGLTGTVILNFDDLNDVDTGTPSDGQLIAYQQGEWVTIDQDEIHIPINSVTGLQTELNTIPTDLSDLNDVSIVGTPAANQALIYNSATNAFTSQDSYTNRFEDEVETGKVMPTIFAERAYSVKSEGDGVFIDPESDTPTAGKVIVRKIYHKTGFITDADVIGDYTLIHTFADDTAYADTVATFEGFEDGATYGVPPFTLLQTWEEVTAAPAFTGLLNETYGSGAEAAYSTRRLNGNVTECMVIRRASDSTTQTIGFDASGNIDEAAINTFCSGTSCTVYQWLDQSGNGNTATTTGTEPIIYTGGAIIKDEGKVAIDFQTAYSPLKYTGQDLNLSAITATLIGRETSQSGSQGWGIVMQSDNNNGFRTHYQGTSVRNRTTGTNLDAIADASVRLTRFIHDIASSTALMKSTLNGVVTATGNGKTFSTNGLDLAVGGSSYSTVQFRGNLSEAILFGVDKYTSGDIASIRENVGDYFTQNTPLLDTYSGAAAAYSLRKLSSSYSGSAIRVRRSSDNTEQDIGFNVFGELDTVSLLAFAGTGDAFVKTWYDQASTNDATQTTTANQPKIVSSGAVIVENGKPAVEFDGSSNILDASLTIPNDFTAIITGLSTNTISNQKFIADETNSKGQLFVNAGNYNWYDGSTVTLLESADVLRHLFFVSADSGGSFVSIDGADQTITGISNTGYGELRIGGRAISSQYLDGNIQEVILYPSDQSDNRSNIETNINTFYSIY